MRRTAQDAVNLQGLLNTANTRINGLMAEIANLRNDSLRREQMMDQA